jgi:hypothetical protein
MVPLSHLQGTSGLGKGGGGGGEHGEGETGAHGGVAWARELEPLVGGPCMGGWSRVSSPARLCACTLALRVANARLAAAGGAAGELEAREEPARPLAI